MIAQAFAKGPALIAYLTLGDGGLDYSLSSALALARGGVDLLEIGLPFSDPIADGPVIQKAMERSLQKGTKPQDVIAFLQAFRKQSQVPIVIFSYYNPILAAGKLFLDQAHAAGANGILIVDLPFEQMPESVLDPVLIVSASTVEISKISPFCATETDNTTIELASASSPILSLTIGTRTTPYASIVSLSSSFPNPLFPR